MSSLNRRELARTKLGHLRRHVDDVKKRDSFGVHLHLPEADDLVALAEAFALYWQTSGAEHWVEAKARMKKLLEEVATTSEVEAEAELDTDSEPTIISTLTNNELTGNDDAPDD